MALPKHPDVIVSEIIDDLTERGTINFCGLERVPTRREVQEATVYAAIKAAHETLYEWERIYSRMYDADTFHASLNYSEAEALAGMLAAVGRYDLARNLIETWAEHDPEMAEEYAEDVAENLREYMEQIEPGEWA